MNDRLHEDIDGLDMAQARREAEALFEGTWRGHDPRRDLWIFGYGSLIWRPQVAHSEMRLAKVYGFHRSFRMRSRVNRGTPERPGLVFALLPGGSCTGVALRIPRRQAEAELRALWQREMPIPVYRPRWLACQTGRGAVTALAFTLPRTSASHLGPIDDARMLDILRHAQGRYGSTLDYLMRTAEGLRDKGIHDAEVHRLATLARRHGLVG